MRMIGNIILLLATYAVYGQGIQYAVVHKGVLHFSEQSTEKGKSDRLLGHDVKDVDSEGVSFVGAIRPSYLPYCWEKTDEGALIYIWGIGGRSGSPAVKLKRIVLAKGGADS